LRIFCKISFTPAVTSYYQVHGLNADAHLSAALLCYFTGGATGAETSLHNALNNYPHLSTLQMDITLVIVVA